MIDFSPVLQTFSACKTREEKYEKLIELGKALSLFPPEEMVQENLVPGCQSLVYLCSCLKEGKIFFLATSDALISKGLAALLIKAYNGHTPQSLIQSKPTFIETLGLTGALSLGRSNGLASMYQQMQRQAIKLLSPV